MMGIASGKGLAVSLALSLLGSSGALAHMKDRPDLDKWFAGLASKKGLCCSFADGVAMSDVDWDTQDGHYRVRLDGEWLVVPDAAVIEEPNRYGPAIVWPYYNPYPDAGQSHTSIRCFMPGAGT